MTSSTQQAVRAVKSGVMTQAEAARKFNISPQAVSNGLKRGSTGKLGRKKKLPDARGRLQCSKCKELKPSVAFSRGGRSNGKRSWCKTCDSAYAKSRLPTRKSLEDRITALEDRIEVLITLVKKLEEEQQLGIAALNGLIYMLTTNPKEPKP